MSQLLGASRRIRALLAAGYPMDDVVERLGWPQPLVASLADDVESFEGVVATLVRRTYEPLEMKPGPDRAAGIAARRRGCVPGLAWDDEPHEPHFWDRPESEPQGVRRLSGRVG